MQTDVIDITYRPKRYQNECGTPYNATNTEVLPSKSPSELPSGYITLEQAIRFYEENATNSTLYTLTAQWLYELRAVRKEAIKARNNEIKAEVMQNVKENTPTEYGEEA